jgi:hypothetical protein
MNRDNLTDDEAALLGLHEPTPDEIAAEKAMAEKLEDRRLMLIGLMQNQDFRAWLMEILIGFNTFGRTFAATPTGFPDHAATEFHLGMKAAGWWIWDQMDTLAPDQASLMRREWTTKPAR